MNPISWSLQESKSNLKTNPALEFNRGSRFPGFQSGFEWPSSVMNLNLYIHIIIYRCVCMYIYIYIIIIYSPPPKKSNYAYDTDFNQFGAPRGVVDGCPGTAQFHRLTVRIGRMESVDCWCGMKGLSQPHLGYGIWYNQWTLTGYTSIYIYIYKQRLAPRMACPKTRNLR